MIQGFAQKGFCFNMYSIKILLWVKYFFFCKVLYHISITVYVKKYSEKWPCTQGPDTYQNFHLSIKLT